MENISLPNGQMDMVFKCDKCHLEFLGKDVELQPAHKNVSFAGFVTPLMINEQGKPCSSNTEGDLRTMHCPHCHEIHLFGFDRVMKNG